jgi:hypothetical protein
MLIIDPTGAVLADTMTISSIKFGRLKLAVAASLMAGAIRRGAPAVRRSPAAARSSSGSRPIAEDVVLCIAADRAHIAERRAAGLRPEPAAAIVRRYGGQTRRAQADARVGEVGEGSPTPAAAMTCFP